MSVSAERLPFPPRLPTEYELPCDDGIPMETPRHQLQMELLIHILEPWAAKRRNVFVSGNQYYWFDPFNPDDRGGFALIEGHYVPRERDPEGWLPVPELGLRLCLWQGEYIGVETTWLRWANNNGLLPLPEEAESARANAAEQSANTAQQQADTKRRRADLAEAELQRLRAELAGLRGGKGT